MMRTTPGWTAAFVCLAAACSNAHDPDVDGSIGAQDAQADTEWLDTNSAPTTVACGGVGCAPGQICCEATSRCVAPHDPSCALPSGSPPGSCASNADCPPGQTCQVLDARGNALPNRCDGIGTCWTNPGSCGGMGAVCGCDGNTYATGCDALAAGARIVSEEGGCGQPIHRVNISCNATPCTHGTCDPSMGLCSQDDLLYACATDAQCPSGQTCCTINGLCYAPSDSAICAEPPAGAIIACGSDADCQRWDGSYWLGGGSQLFCDGPACGGPGGCVSAPGSCDGVLAAVCGCDGRTYTNECEAHRSQVRVAHTGAC